jgi:exopolyphosphatase / guanosine-5'-triphosphate,3'-diphosphate pyrophosphatase
MPADVDRPRYAGIDAGSNTFRLLVAAPAADGKGFEFLHARREMTRLGTGLNRSATLDAEAARRSREVLASFAGDIIDSGAAWTVAVGTGALRDAQDGPRFAAGVAADLGLALTVIDQETEALLTITGAGSVFGDDGPLAAFDIGGKSTELVIRGASGTNSTMGFALGVVDLRERFLLRDPPGPGEVAAMRMFIDGILEAANPPRLPPGIPLAGTGGTVTTLAAMNLGLASYDRERINRHVLSRGRMTRLLQLLLSLDGKCRAALPGLEPGRGDLIIPGAVLLLALMDRLGRREVAVSDAGLLEGCLLAGLRNDPPLPKTPTSALRRSW